MGGDRCFFNISGSIFALAFAAVGSTISERSRCARCAFAAGVAVLWVGFGCALPVRGYALGAGDWGDFHRPYAGYLVDQPILEN